MSTGLLVRLITFVTLVAAASWLSHRVFGTGEGTSTAPRSPARKICFWLLVLLTPLILGSIILSMYPVFGTAGQGSLRTL